MWTGSTAVSIENHVPLHQEKEENTKIFENECYYCISKVKSNFVT